MPLRRLEETTLAQPTRTTVGAEVAVRLEGVRVVYRRGAVRVTALQGIDLEISRGDFLAIQGPSGSGKSTLLRVLAGLWPPSSGRVTFDGQPVSDFSDAELSAMRRRRIGFVHQLFNLLPDLSVDENVGLPLLLDGVSHAEASARTGRVLERLGVGGLGGRLPEELSGGEMLRVALARALVIEPLLVLADEPTGSLDRDNSLRVLDLFREIHGAGDVTLVVVTHDPEVAAAAHRTLHIVDGRLIGEPPRGA